MKKKLAKYIQVLKFNFDFGKVLKIKRLIASLRHFSMLTFCIHQNCVPGTYIKSYIQIMIDLLHTKKIL